MNNFQITLSNRNPCIYSPICAGTGSNPTDLLLR
jgi:hypothetical protein